MLDDSSFTKIRASWKAWLQKGFEDGLFLLSGSWKTKSGGIIAHVVLPDDLAAYINEDPFVKEGVVTAEIVELPHLKQANA
ncbi:MAG: hypothetical protein AAFW84_30640 [Cyanobacteria bacterium J06635_15]